MINFQDVAQSYTGKVGCACGCQGKYQIASHYGIEAANKACGYDGYDVCSDRSVKGTVAKLNKLIDWTNPASVAECVQDEYATFETDNGRVLTVYFVNDKHGKQIRMEAAGRGLLAAAQVANEIWAIA